MFRPIRLDHTNCLQVAIKTHTPLSRCFTVHEYPALLCLPGPPAAYRLLLECVLLSCFILLSVGISLSTTECWCSLLLLLFCSPATCCCCCYCSDGVHGNAAAALLTYMEMMMLLCCCSTDVHGNDDAALLVCWCTWKWCCCSVGVHGNDTAALLLNEMSNS